MPKKQDQHLHPDERKRELLERFDRDPQSARKQLAIQPFYHLVENDIIKPNRGTFVTTYFRKRWRKCLGSDCAAVVEALRQLADKDTGVTFASHQTIADVAGLSLSTVQRFLSRKPPAVWKGQRLEQWNLLHTHFIKAMKARYRIVEDRNGPLKRRTTSEIKVAMDEPIHPDDEPLLFRKAAERIVEEEAAAGAAIMGSRPGVHPNRQSDGQGHITIGEPVDNARPDRQPDGHVAPSLRRSRSVVDRSNVVNVKAKPSQNGAPVFGLTPHERERRDAACFGIMQSFYDKARDRDALPMSDPYLGLYRRLVTKLGQSRSYRARAITLDAFQDGRVNVSSLHRYFFGVCRRIAEYESIELGVNWRLPASSPSSLSAPGPENGPQSPGDNPR